MLILTIRTDKPEAELGLFSDSAQLACFTWHAHRELAETIHQKIKELLKSQQKTLKDIQGIVVFKGPGSFTGLRIGISVANTLADSEALPIIGSAGEQWVMSGITQLRNNDNQRIVMPEYGAPPHVTAPKH